MAGSSSEVHNGTTAGENENLLRCRSQLPQVPCAGGEPAMRSQPFLRTTTWCLVTVALTAACSSVATAPAVPPTPSSGPDFPASSVAAADTPTTIAATTPPATMPTPSTAHAPPLVDREVLAGISMTSVPPDVIVPTSPASLDEVTNPINGRRSSRRPPPEELECAAGPTATCLTGLLDLLGFDVASGSSDDRQRRVQRATAVVQLDAGLPPTGVPDDALLEYLGLATESTLETRADEVRRIGTSANGRPIVAQRWGDGPRTVLVIGQTHGDEEGGRRVLLRAQALAPRDGVTLWFVPTMNPDGLALDTRFLANGADPNRRAPSQPEQQAVYDFALAIQPSLAVWYHQNYAWVGGSGASTAPATLYQALTGLGTLKRSGDCAVGFMWCPIDEALASSSILVELPDVLTPADVRTHAVALLAVASSEAP
jgi:Zinc carboxypeptidase